MNRVVGFFMLFLTLTHSVATEEPLPSPLSPTETAMLERMISVFRDGRVDPDLCLEVMNRQRKQKSFSDVEDASFRYLFHNTAKSMESERLIQFLNAMEDPGSQEWNDLIFERCPGNEHEQLLWSRFAVAAKDGRTHDVAGYIATSLQQIEIAQGLSAEAYSLLTTYMGQGGLTRENPDFDRSLHDRLHHQHWDIKEFGDGRSFAAALRLAMRFRSREQLLPMVAKCAMEKDTTPLGAAFYRYAQLALGSRDPALATGLCEAFAADLKESGNHLSTWLARIYQDYQLLRAGYNPLLREPFADGSHLPDSVHDAFYSRPVDYISSLLKDGHPNFDLISTQSLGAPGDFERRELVSYLHIFLTDYLESRSSTERLGILADGRLFPLILWEIDRSPILPTGRGGDAVFLKPWIDAINRCPDVDTREWGLLALARSNQGIFGKSAGTCMILDSMLSLDKVDASIACATPHRRITESVQRELANQHHTLTAMDVPGPYGFINGSNSLLFQLLKSAHNLIPEDQFIGMIEKQNQLPDSGLCTKASYGLACMLLGSKDPVHRESLRFFLALHEKSNREIDDRLHGVKVMIYERYACLEHGINWLNVPELGDW